MNGDTLTSFLYLAGIGLFFYWMMRRGGCGMHGGHGHDGHGHGGGDHDDPGDHDDQRQHRHHGC